MIQSVIFSEDVTPVDWSEAIPFKLKFGPKAATLAVLPRDWTPPFALIAAELFGDNGRDGNALLDLGEDIVSRIRDLAPQNGSVYVRSSIIGETIWDRGSYESVCVSSNSADFQQELVDAVTEVLASAPDKSVGLVIQRYVRPYASGEFGNLLRISSSRDRWELSSTDAHGNISRIRLNSQRDEAADACKPLMIKSGVPQERLFGSVAAWLNNDLLRGHLQRLTCEWIADERNIYLVQLDEEDEDEFGINPFQIRVATTHQPAAATGAFLEHAKGHALQDWDKLSVLDELWEPDASHKPTLFWVQLSRLPASEDHQAHMQLKQDFEDLIGPDKIVVRTSVRAGQEKIPNLERTEGLTSSEAADWCLRTRDRFAELHPTTEHLAFIAHRFMAARASAWVRAEPDNPLVEIHSLWGLPDALQYCPYDIWEVHLPTGVATETPDYKPHMMLATEDGSWEQVRIKNELGRHISISRSDAVDLAVRTAAIAGHLNKACHVMWFVGCVDHEDAKFSVPWYWTEAHESERNADRSNYQVLTIATQDDLDNLKSHPGPMARCALELVPTDQNLMRDMGFISAVGEAANDLGVPVLLSGSTLAHTYFVLRRQNCTVVAKGEKKRSKIRRSATFGKIVRDKVPDRIAKRKELGITRKVTDELRKGFLTSKLLEEALEVRMAGTPSEKCIELADVYEVIRALAQADGISIEQVVSAADEKKSKSGGFDKGLVLFQTGILGRNRKIPTGNDDLLAQVLARRLSGDTFELPFTFFGFMPPDLPRSLLFEDLGVRLSVSLKNDCIELQISREAEQLEFPLPFAVVQHEENETELEVMEEAEQLDLL